MEALQSKPFHLHRFVLSAVKILPNALRATGKAFQHEWLNYFFNYFIEFDPILVMGVVACGIAGEVDEINIDVDCRERHVCGVGGDPPCLLAGRKQSLRVAQLARR